VGGRIRMSELNEIGNLKCDCGNIEFTISVARSIDQNFEYCIISATCTKCWNIYVLSDNRRRINCLE